MLSPVRTQSGRCLPLSRWRVECGACVSACPIGALSFSDDRIVVSQACFGCGRCGAMCPTGALEVEGFDGIAEEVSVVEGAAIRLECERVSREALLSGATTVPCLGGLGTDRLLELVLAGGERPVLLIDRGLCAACPAGGAGFSLGALVASAVSVLQKTGCDPDALPAVELRPLSVDRRRDDARAGGTGLSRRSLFRRLSRDVPARRIAESAFPPAARKLAETDALRRLAVRIGRPLPAIFPVADLSKTCADHRVCAAACPTGALAVEANESSRSMVFTPDRCIDCGRCEDVCPTGSIHIAETGGRIGKVALAVRGLSVCSGCEDEFSDDDGSGFCAACRKEKSIRIGSLVSGSTAQGIEESAP